MKCTSEKNISLAIDGYKIFFPPTSLTLECQPMAGLKLNCKPVVGLNTKNRQLISGRGKPMKVNFHLTWTRLIKF